LNFSARLISSTNSLKSHLKTSGLSEVEAISLAEKFKPVVYFHKDETSFPTNVNEYNIDWSKATFGNTDATVDTNKFKGSTSLKQDAPYYVSILENSDGTCRISYVIHYGFNPAGPTIHFKAKLVGVGIDIEVTPGNYGLGVHYGDNEHIEVTLNKGYGSIKQIVYAYHSYEMTVSGSGFETENGTHPVVYVAKGSHASYPTKGDQNYNTVWDKSKKTLGVTVYDTYLKFYDHPPSSKSSGKRWYSTNLRVLKLNGNKMESVGMSTNEYNIGFKYSGRLGLQYDNRNVDALKSALGYNTFYKAMKKVSKSTANDMDDALNEKLDEFEIESLASMSLNAKGYW